VLKVSAVEVVYTQLHAGGKFNNENYAYSGGLHGVGASVVNALSRWLKVEVCRGGKKYEQEFESKEGKNGKISGGVPKAPLAMIGSAVSTGTKVTFMPDDRIFETVEFDYSTINKHIKEQAFLNKGLEICLIDARNPKEEPIVKSYKYDGGIKDFVKYLNESKTTLYEEPIYISGASNDIKVEVAIFHTDEYVDNIFSYVNNIPTSEGGTHEVGFRSAVTKVLNDLARKNNILKDKDASLVGDDFKEGLSAVISIKMKNVQFEGQTKAKLGNPEARPAVEAVTTTELTKYFAQRGATRILGIIIDKAMGAARVREAGRKAKEIARQTNSLENTNILASKLAACTGKNYANNELFIVEGNSAGGTAKQARTRHFQAVLPLRGKPLNVEKKRLDQVLQNEEFRTLIAALGAGIGEKFNIENLKYHKVIILADADQDGAHIRAILLTFFYRYMRELITEGHVYVGMPPLYKLKKKDMVEYVYSDAEIDEAISRFGSNYKLSRYKGLGEMNAEELWATTLDPKERTIVQVTIEDAAEAEKMITTLMGDNIEARKQYISDNADFNKVDKAMALLNKKK
jgi:DNA gyrase subunit B